MAWGIHLGSRLTLGFLALDLDAGIKQSYQDLQENDPCYGVPSARATLGFKDFGFYWGVSSDFSFPGYRDSSLYTGPFCDFGSDGRIKGYYRYIIGFRI